MSTLHQSEVYGWHKPSVYETTGEPVEVQGVPMVRLSHGIIVPHDARWFASKAEAKRAAADSVDAMQRELAELAARLRAEAEVAT